METYKAKVSDAKKLTGDQQDSAILDAHEALSDNVLSAKKPLERIDEWEKKEKGTRAVLIEYMKTKKDSPNLLWSKKVG